MLALTLEILKSDYTIYSPRIRVGKLVIDCSKSHILPLRKYSKFHLVRNFGICIQYIIGE